jgi:hypothetical protein
MLRLYEKEKGEKERAMEEKGTKNYALSLILLQCSLRLLI